MGLVGGLEAGENVQQYLDLKAVELLAYFFTTEEMVTDLHLLDLNPQEQTLLKASLLQEIARLIVQQQTPTAEVRARVQSMANALWQHAGH